MTAEGRRSEERRRNLRAITADGIAHSGMVGLGETYVPAFALALGHGEVAAGLLATVPLLTGATLQVVTPAAVRWLGSHRRWLVTCALLQAATFVPLVFAALKGHFPLPLLFLVTALYWAAGLSASSAWNSWLASLVPSRIRAPFFARRTRLAQIALVASLAAGGALLQGFSAAGAALTGFAVLFGLAAACRVVSARFLSTQSDVLPERIGIGGLSELFHAMHRGSSGRLFTYLVSLQLAVHIAAPYFTPYMLQRLSLSYGEFVALTGCAFVSRVLALPLLGDVARRAGARQLLRISGLAVVPLSALWIVSDHFVYLLGIQVLAGIAWGGYDLAVQLLFFETFDGRRRLGLLATLNLANALAMVGGSLIGGWILDTLGTGSSAYFTIFAVSALSRALTLVLLRRVPEVKVRHAPLPGRVAAVRPSLGAIQPPVVAAATSREETEGPEG